MKKELKKLRTYRVTESEEKQIKKKYKDWSNKYYEVEMSLSRFKVMKLLQ